MREELAAKVRAHAEDDVDFPMPVSGHTGGDHAHEIPA